MAANAEFVTAPGGGQPGAAGLQFLGGPLIAMIPPPPADRTTPRGRAGWRHDRDDAWRRRTWSRPVLPPHAREQVRSREPTGAGRIVRAYEVVSVGRTLVPRRIH
jgi:hypothetical protein